MEYETACGYASLLEYTRRAASMSRTIVTPGIVRKAGLKSTLMASLVVLAGGLVWLAASPSDADFVRHVLGPSILVSQSADRRRPRARHPRLRRDGTDRRSRRHRYRFHRRIDGRGLTVNPRHGPTAGC